MERKKEKGCLEKNEERQDDGSGWDTYRSVEDF
jgi:hypothetical protein